MIRKKLKSKSQNSSNGTSASTLTSTISSISPILDSFILPILSTLPIPNQQQLKVHRNRSILLYLQHLKIVTIAKLQYYLRILIGLLERVQKITLKQQKPMMTLPAMFFPMNLVKMTIQGKKINGIYLEIKNVVHINAMIKAICWFLDSIREFKDH